MKRILNMLVIILVLSTIWPLQNFAKENASLVEIHEGEKPEIFVKGISDVTGATAIIGNTENKSVEAIKLNDSEVLIDTLILIDNSMSIPEARLEELKEIITQLVGARKDGQERFSIATYSTSVGDLPEFSSDYKSIQQYVHAITRVDQDTRLTDAIAEIMKSDLMGESEVCSFKRLIVFSDGVDNQGGYSISERNRLLNNTIIPVYTIGVYDNKGTNDKSLTELFSLSRETNATYFLLSNKAADKINVLLPGENCYQINDDSEWTILADVFNSDRDIYKFSITLEDEIKDGSSKTITLKINSQAGESTIIADDVRMPHAVIENSIEQPKEEAIINAEVVSEEPTSTQIGKLLLPIIILAIIFVVVILAIIYILKKKKKVEKPIIELDFSKNDDPFIPEKDAYEEATVMIDAASDSSGSTVMIFNQGQEYHITLTDVNNPSYSFTKPIRECLTIGKSVENSDIAITYDKSVSRKHCQITRRGGDFYVADIGSLNGTFVNGEKVMSPTEIFSGSILTVGRTELKVTIE